ncbi:hypothetical protein HRbin24_00778 [bacterium HR24]|nr:hypothetical protein HRbin24_00778 [bacterium HR24]
MKGKRVSKAEALAECLEAARQGERALMSCLDRYPRMRQELTALVLVASLIPPAGPKGRMSEEGRRRAKAAVLSRLGHFEDRRHGKAGVA